MAARLLGLMALLLLGTLLAAWALVGYHQERLMQELTRTVSAVSEATLRSVEVAPSPGREAETVIVDAPDGRTVIELDGAAIVSDSAVPDPERPGLAVRPDRVHAAREPGRGLVLRIPAFHRDTAGGGRSDVTDAPRRAGDIVLPVPTQDFAALVGDLRRKALLALGGVFAAGLVVAMAGSLRLTRPVRALDEGMRRLADGDLSVAVASGGRGEIGRLGLGFNAMVKKLRASRERERELARRDRLASLGCLAAGVAHDVRNPLHSIGLTLSHLRAAGRPEDGGRAREFDEAVSLIAAEMRRLDGLVEGFLRFARADRSGAGPVDLGGLARETVQLVSKEAERRRVVLRVDVAPDVPPAQARAESIRSALLNLVLNAFAAMPDGGMLAIGVRSSGSGVVLSVGDSGRGIPPEKQEKVFDFGYSERPGGSGLGLAMVHHVVVEEHGGRVALTSAPGQGTSVELWLPALARVGTGPAGTAAG